MEFARSSWSKALPWIALVSMLIAAIPFVAEAVAEPNEFAWLKHRFWTVLAGIILVFTLIAKIEILENTLEFDFRLAEKLNAKLSESGFFDKTSVRVLDPKNESDFFDAFGKAKEVFAYNPPLRLLVRRPGHRNIIHSILDRPDGRYRIIAGNECVKRVRELKQAWGRELSAKHKVDHKREVLNRMEVIHYDSKYDLHTEINDWFDKIGDLRGLCFFLVKYRGGERGVLMYILGRPFVEEFNVPDYAMLVRSNEPEFPLYEMFEREYGRRWTALADASISRISACRHDTLFNFPEESVGAKV